MEALILVIVLLVIAGITAIGRSIKVVQQYEKGVLYRFGRVQPQVIEPGLSWIRPIGDRLHVRRGRARRPADRPDRPLPQRLR